MAKRILVIGSANIDFIVKTPYVPERGETLVAEGGYSLMPGGKGANTAVAVSRLGAQAVFCSRVGDDAYGERLKKIYAENGIDLRFVRTDKIGQTGLAVVLVEKDGANRIIVYPGANLRISEGDVESAFTCYPDAVMAQLESGEDVAVYTSQLAAEEGIPFILDGGGASASFRLNKLQKVDLFSPNETETALITGIRPDTLDDCLRASMAICSQTAVGYVVLKLGARGCYIYDGKYCDLIAPFDVQAVDTTAAGDAFTAALATEFLRTGDITASARYANAVGALTVTTAGAINALPTRETVRRFLEQI